MSTVVVKTILKFKRGTAAQWTDVNPILQAGEPGFETDSNKLKVGNGVDHWNDLPYLAGGGGTGVDVSADGKSISIKYVSGVKTFYVEGFDSADAGQVPMKSTDGTFDWVDLDDTIDTQIKSTAYTKAETDTKLAAKQNKLTAGLNIQIDSNNVISAVGIGATNVDNKSIKLDTDSNISIVGYSAAETGETPVKGADGLLTWEHIATPEAMTEAEIREICK